MSIRIREGYITAVRIGNDWHKVKLGTFQVGDFDFVGLPAKGKVGVIDYADDYGFMFDDAEHDNNLVAGPLKSITAVRMVKE